MTGGNAVALINATAAAYLSARCLHTVARLGVADAIGDAPRPLGEVADEVGADTSALGRILRHLAALGIFELRAGGVAHTHASRLLRADHAHTLLPIVQFHGLPILWDSFRDLDETARSGRPAAETKDPRGFFGYLSSHPDESDLFDAGMNAMTKLEVAELVPAYDFTDRTVIADIGGGRGQLLRAVLDATPWARGILHDQPHVLAKVEPHPCMSFHPGDFFVDPLPAADCYLLKRILHDWDDAEATAILQAIRKASPPDAIVLLFEYVVPEAGDEFVGTNIDVIVLTLLTGRERTRDEYAALLAGGGFELVRTIPTARLTILEARPA
jgi:O-methyltransferase domain